MRDSAKSFIVDKAYDRKYGARHVSYTHLTGVEPNVSSDVIKKNISVSAGSIKILNSSGVENNGIVGTGNKIAVDVYKRQV